jgi:hypothetical protein
MGRGDKSTDPKKIGETEAVGLARGFDPRGPGRADVGGGMDA